MKSFLTACGLEDPLQLVVETQTSDERELRILHEPFAVIGRDLRADLLLDHPQVSRRHVYLQVVGGRAFWVDLESRTGARGPRESQKFGWLQQGQTLSVGPYTIRRFHETVQNDANLNRVERLRDVPLFARSPSHATLPEVALEFLNGPMQSMCRPVHRVLSLIGSASGCKFRLTDPSVSRFHGSLLQTPTGLWIVDLLGQAGITVNDVASRCSSLVDGDVLKIGRYQIRIRCEHRNAGARTGFVDQNRDTGTRQSQQDRLSSGTRFRDWAARSRALEPGVTSARDAQLPLPYQPPISFPNTEIVPANAPGNHLAQQPDLTGSVLIPLVNQFGLMQQQMFDQFQQSMAMMVQMIGTMHHDQMEMIRAELKEIQDLTKEFNTLRTELASRPEGPAKLAEIAISRSTHQPAEASLKTSAISPIAESLATNDNPRASQPAAPAPAPVSRGLPSSSAPAGQQSRSEELKEPGRRTAPVPPASAQSTTSADRDTVAWLHQRIVALQHERESRWQKILKLLPGM